MSNTPPPYPVDLNDIAAPPYQVNPQEASSSAPSIGSRSERSSRSGNNPAVESAVTRLLVSIKALLESLTKWSEGQMSDMDVSDVYVRLGNDFNAAVAAFAVYGVEMKELLSIPEDLRNILETCLAEEARPENLQRFLPEVRKVITNLLQGLRGKQTTYRKIISEQKHRSDASGHSRHESRSSVRSSRRDTAGSHRSPHRGGPDGPRTSSSLRRTVTTSRRNPSLHGIDSPPRPPLVEESDDGGFVGGFVAPQPPTIGDIGLGSPSSTPPSRHVSTNGHPFYDDDVRSMSSRMSTTHSTSSPTMPSAQIPHQSPAIPATMKRYSLVDKPMNVPSVVVDDIPGSPDQGDDPASPELPLPPFEPPSHEPLPAPAIANSLNALKQSDALERRASKRFSTYNITKMTGSRLVGAGSRKSMVASSSALTPGDLATLTEAEEGASLNTPRKRERSTRKARQPVIQEQDEEETLLSVPTVSATESAKEESAPSDTQSEVRANISQKPPPPAPNQPFTVFMQVGREVKKATIDPGLTMPMLRVLFMDKFSYSPGMDSFPAIYIRDGSSGIQYELEDMDEIKERCLLSLNIEPLDQIKQHIDSQVSNLSNDIKDLRAIVASSQRASNPPIIVGKPFTEEASPTTARPTDKQFQRAAGRLSKIYNDGTPADSKPDGLPESSPPVLSQMTGASMASFAGTEVTTRIVGDLRTQFDEVQNLRRDLGVMRQLYSEFMKSTKDTLGSLRGQTQTVRQLASQKVSGARSYIEDGKAKLDTRSQNVLTKMEELQDTVENVKGDALKRHVSPRPQVLKAIKADIEYLSNELTSLKDHITTVKPMWKKTWEEELQLIVEEQQFLSHQEEFLMDLQEDHKAVLEVWGHVEKVISLRGSGAGKAAGKSRQLARQVTGEADPGSLSNVMAEIRGNSVDAQKRLKAIAANEKSREKEKANQGDEFQAELSGFVGGKKLKMTGGAEEADRLRQKRNDQTLKAMFTGGSASPAH